MADLTSLYQKKPKRDLSIQACVDCLNKLALEFPNDFSNGYFTDYFDISGGTQPPKSQFIHEPKDGYIRFLQIRDFASDNTPTYIPITKNNKTCDVDDIVLGRYGASVGKILTGKSGAYNVACAKIIFLNENEVDRDYLFYWLHSSYFQNFLTSISRSAQGGFNKNDISRIHFNIPSIKLQKRIVSLFKSVDKDLLEDRKPNLLNFVGSELELRLVNLMSKFLNIITEKEDLQNELTHQLDLIKQLRQAFLREAMQGKLVKSTNTKQTGHELLAKIKAEKQKNLPAGAKRRQEKELLPITADEIPFEIPEHWVWCRLGDLSKYITSGSRDWSKFYSNDGAYFIRSGEIKSNNLIIEDAIKVNLPTKIEGKRSLVEKGDLLTTITGGNVGKCAFIFDEIPEAYVSQSVALTKLIDIRLGSFIHFCFQSPIGTGEDLKTSVYGIGRPVLSLPQIQNLKVPLPPLHEQEQIVAKLEELMKFCDGLEQSIIVSQGYNEQLLQQVLREALQGNTVINE